jgi:hypothetical protein
MARTQASTRRGRRDEEIDDEDEDDEIDASEDQTPAQRKLSLRAFAERVALAKKMEREDEDFALLRVLPGSSEDEECSPTEITMGRPGTTYRFVKREKRADDGTVIETMLAEAMVPESEGAQNQGNALVAGAFINGFSRLQESYEGQLALSQGQIKYANDRELKLLELIADKDKEIGKLNKKLNEQGQKGFGSPETLSMMMPAAIYAMGQFSPAKKHRDQVIQELLDEIGNSGRPDLVNAICEHMAKVDSEKMENAVSATRAQAEHIKNQQNERQRESAEEKK